MKLTTHLSTFNSTCKSKWKRTFTILLNENNIVMYCITILCWDFVTWYCRPVLTSITLATSVILACTTRSQLFLLLNSWLSLVLLYADLQMDSLAPSWLDYCETFYHRTNHCSATLLIINFKAKTSILNEIKIMKLIKYISLAILSVCSETVC